MGDVQDQLFRAATAGDFIRTNHLMSKMNARADKQNKDGWTAAGMAAYRSRNGVVQVMLDNGVSAGLTGSMGITLLHVASMYGKPLIVRQLLAEGALADVADESGKTPLDVASSPEIRTLLAAAAENNEYPESIVNDSQYTPNEQVFCKDKAGHWWPAIIKSGPKPGEWYEVHFPGFGKREDLTVRPDSLKKACKESIEALGLDVASEEPVKKPKRSARQPPAAEVAAPSPLGKRKAAIEAKKVIPVKPSKRKKTCDTVLHTHDNIVNMLNSQRDHLARLVDLCNTPVTTAAPTGRDLSGRQDALDAQEKALAARERELKKQEKDMLKQFKQQSNQNQAEEISKLKKEISKLKQDVSQKELAVAKLETAKLQLQATNERLQGDLERKGTVISRLADEKEKLLNAQSS